MAFWDAVSGKIFTWNKNKDISTEQFVRNLTSWHEQALNSPGFDEESILQIRDYFFGHWTITLDVVSAELDDSLSKYKNNFFSLSAKGITEFACTIQSFMLTLQHSDSQSVYDFYMHTTQSVYNKPSEYQDIWSQPVIIDNGKLTLGMHSSAKCTQLREICRILNLKDVNPIHPLETIFWEKIALRIANTVKLLSESPNFRELVNKDIRERPWSIS
ncbi:MAG: hypothetical protein JKY95_05155 [Planctomycetaceae bacterium]|nr:hypothetical protein [Planctomycetaceae bacterium]